MANHFGLRNLSIAIIFTLFAGNFSFVALEETQDCSCQPVCDENPDDLDEHYYALDYQKAVNLSKLEHKLVRKLLEWSTKKGKCKGGMMLDRCNLAVENYVEDFKEQAAIMKRELKSHSPVKTVADNPLLLFTMIKRLHISLEHDVLFECYDHPELLELVDNTFSPENFTLPSESDLEDAMLGLLRIHFVYRFNASSELRFGKFGDIHTNVPLNVYDCLDIGEVAMSKGAYVLAYQWFLSAYLILKEPSLEVKYEREAWEELESFWSQLLEASPYDTMVEMRNGYEQAYEKTWTEAGLSRFEMYAGCRGESMMEEKMRSKLKCYLERQRHPYFAINPEKVEVLNFNGTPVLQFHNFVGNETIEYIVNNATPGFYRSGVLGYETNNLKRTSMTSWIRDHLESNPDKKLVALNKRIGFVTGMQLLKKGSSEELQIVSYSSLGSHFDFHEDALPDEWITVGNRIVTFFMFLSDVLLGGNLAFPTLNVFAKPVKGDAVFWFPLLRNGKSDSRTLHGGCPIIIGTKMGANKWIYQFDNMWNYQCSLNKEE